MDQERDEFLRDALQDAGIDPDGANLLTTELAIHLSNEWLEQEMLRRELIEMQLRCPPSGDIPIWSA